MKKILLTIGILMLTTVAASAQDKKKQRPIAISQILEADAKKNLNVAWQYFKLRKAYRAVLMRTEEIIAAHPRFSKIDEVLYLTGMSSHYLSIGKGKQKATYPGMSKEEKLRFGKNRLEEDAIAFLGMLVEEHPKSKYRKKAAKVLAKIQPKK